LFLIKSQTNRKKGMSMSWDSPQIMGVFAVRESEQQAVDTKIHLLIKYYVAKRFKIVLMLVFN